MAANEAAKSGEAVDVRGVSAQWARERFDREVIQIAKLLEAKAMGVRAHTGRTTVEGGLQAVDYVTGIVAALMPYLNSLAWQAAKLEGDSKLDGTSA
jgi:hypothetical protein